jgi:hypothetical protein
MSKKNILVQIDPDQSASVFDSVVAIDSGVDHLLVKDSVSVPEVTSIVHGAIFTRGADDLKNTALFFGGSDVQQTEKLVEQAKKSFFGPMRVSMMSDPNGSNTTAAAAVLCAGQHIDWNEKTVTILAATGPVGERIATILGNQSVSGLTVRVCSRKLLRATTVVERLKSSFVGVNFEAVQTRESDDSLAAVQGADVVFAAGAAGVELLPFAWQSMDSKPSVVIDLNAVPPAGVAGIEVTDKGRTLDGGSICYGAIGVGGLKMKIHRQCVAALFESNEKVLEINEIFEVGKSLVG